MPGAALGLHRVAAPAATALLTAAALASIAVWARNVPLAEDWNLVPALTGHEPDLSAWLWSQNNEHRLPVQRAIYLGLLRATQDVRSAMALNVALLCGLSLLLARTAARLRGRPALADAAFPLALLHLGHWENLVWGWQIQFVWSVVLTGLALWLIVRRPAPLGPGPSAAAALLLPALALSGGNGLILAAGLVPWLACQALAQSGHRWLAPEGRPAAPRAGRIAWAGALLTVGAIGAYFAGYVPPPWSPPLATPEQSLRAAGRYLAYGFGPGSRVWPEPFAVAAAAFCGYGAWLALRAAWRDDRAERVRAIGLLLFVGTLLAVGAIIAVGRGGIPGRLPDRYALFSVLPLLGAAFAILLYAPRPVARRGPALLAAAFLAMLPLNVEAGFDWRDWYVRGMERVERDIAAGVPIPALAAAHRAFLMHWSEDGLRDRMRMLRAAGIPPFSQAAP